MNAVTVAAPLRRQAMAIGFVGIVLTVLAFLTNRSAFFSAYLEAYCYFLAIPLGCFAILMVHSLTGGDWGWAMRPFLDAGTRMMPIMAILFIPIVLGMHELYSWTRPGVMDDPILATKASYLNMKFFLCRVAFYFAFWVFYSVIIRKLLLPKKDMTDYRRVHRLQRFAAAGLLFYVLTASFAAIDWLQALEPHWFSSMFGGIFVIGQGMSTFAFVSIMAVYFNKRVTNPYLYEKSLHDMGKFLFMTILVWAYFSVSQYLIIWSGNLPEETYWYQMRGTGLWQWYSAALVGGLFLFPFLVLLPKQVKASQKWLPIVACWVLLFRFFEQIWVVSPSFHDKGFPIQWTDLVLFIGMGGFFVAVYTWMLGRARWEGDLTPVPAAAHAPKAAPKKDEPQDKPMKRPEDRK